MSEQIALASSALTAVSILLFCVYFYRVRSALRRFLMAVSGEEMLARVQVPEEAAAPERPADEGTGETR